MLTKLTPERHDLIWGSRDTEPWFPNPNGLRTAEVWYPSGDLLIKFLFTTENLSVQVHPNDEQALRAGKTRGKTEMWQILRAEPGARIALGLNGTVGKDELRAAALEGSIVNLLNWIPVSAGQTFFAPANTIHAIGAGIALCEIQQMSDVTYRLYDWGRGRELHLDEGLEVSKLESGGERPTTLPVRCPYFVTDELRVAVHAELDSEDFTLVVLDGSGDIGGHSFAPGDAFQNAAAATRLAIDSEAASFLIVRAASAA